MVTAPPPAQNRSSGLHDLKPECLQREQHVEVGWDAASFVSWLQSKPASGTFVDREIKITTKKVFSKEIINKKVS
jgi:hypothetical protein